jgi:hypothetical protein
MDVTPIVNFLRGYRTYLVGAGFLISGIIDFIDGNAGGFDKILQGLGFIFVRHSIAGLKEV